VLAGGGVVVDAEHDLAAGVAVDDVLVAVGQRLDGLVLPDIVVVAEGARRIAVGEGAQAAGAGGAALALGHLLGDAAGGVVLELVVGVARDLLVGGGGRVADGGDQPGVGGGIEGELQAAGEAGRLALGVVTVILGVQDVAGAVLDGGGLEVAGVAVGHDAV